MHHTLSTLILCGLQVSVVAIFGLVASWLLVRMRPTIATTVSCSTMVVVGVLTLLAPLPSPSWIHRAVGHLAERSQTSLSIERTNRSVARSALEQPGESPDAALARIDLHWLAQRFGKAASRIHNDAPRGSHVPYVLGIIVVLSLLGLVRLWVAWRFARNVYVAGIPLEDPGIDRIVDEFVERLCPGQRVRIRQTDQLSGAAVSGWWRPTILLPSDWRQWSESELRSVLAHELAHIARRDFLWRTVSCIVTTTHYYNPLVHFLMRHTALTQEIAADALAGQIVGRKQYVQTLSSLALRRDDTDTCFSRTSLQPVFSGYLIRRIKMLKSQQSSHYTKERFTARLSGAALVMIIGGLVFAAGIVAQSLGREQAKTETESLRVARSNSRKADRVADLGQGLFRRELTDPTVMPENDQGMIKVRIGDIFQQTDAVGLEAMINRLWADALGRLLESPEQPTFDISAADTVFGTTQLETRYRPKQKGPQKNSIQLGVSDMVIQFAQPVNVSKWMDDFAPNVEKTRQKGRLLYTFPPMPAIGPAPISFVVVDERTIAFSTKMVDLKLPITDSSAQKEALVTLAEYQQQPNESAWVNAFRRVDGGLIAYAVTNQGIRTRDEFECPYPEGSKKRLAAETFHRIEHAFETFAFGIDLDQTGDHLGVRIRLGCSQRANAEQIAEDVRTMRRLGLDQLDVGKDTLDESDDEFKVSGFEMSKQFLQQMTIAVEDHADGTSDVYVQSHVSNPSILGLFGRYVAAGLEDSKPQDSPESPPNRR